MDKSDREREPRRVSGYGWWRCPLDNRKQERMGVAIEDSTPIPDDPDGCHTVRVQLDSGRE